MIFNLSVNVSFYYFYLFLLFLFSALRAPVLFMVNHSKVPPLGDRGLY